MSTREGLIHLDIPLKRSEESKMKDLQIEYLLCFQEYLH